MKVAQLYPTLCPPHGILQARILEWVAFSLQGISPAQGSNPGLPQDSLPAELRGKPLKGPYLLPNFLGEKAKMSPLVAVMVVAGLESGGGSLLKQAQFSCSVVSDSLWANRSIPGLPVHHQLPEFTQTHVHHVGDAIQLSHPLSSPSPPALNPSQHQGLFQWVNTSHEVAKVLEFQLQHQSFQWTPRTDFL